jgi:hypothetical protein
MSFHRFLRRISANLIPVGLGISIHSKLFCNSGPTNAQLKKKLDIEGARHTGLIKNYNIATERLWALERTVANLQWARY